MTDMMKEIEERANLAGTNRLEVLMFSLEERTAENSELFGLNVFKVRELLAVPPLMDIPMTPSCMKGMANIRGRSVPVIDLKEYCGIKDPTPPKILILTEYNNSVQGFLVHDVDNIIQLAWSDIKPPPPMVTAVDSSVLTAISELEDQRMLLIIDVEKILAEVLGSVAQEKEGKSPFDAASKDSLLNHTIFFADDSAVARAQVKAILDRMGADTVHANDGLQAWEKLSSIANQAEEEGVPLTDKIQAIITDVEMPGLDGFMLTKNVKQDPRFKGVPVIMHSSLSSESNKRLGANCGADSYVAKLQPKELSDTLESYLL
ncbi:MAG: chemotaxis protein [bacterium]